MPAPPNLSQKDANQVLRAVIDDATNRLMVDAVISPDGHDLEISHLDDSIAIGTPTELFTATDIGPKVALDVNVANTTPIPVVGTITTSPNVNVHDGTGVSISSTGSSLNVDVTNTVPVTGSGNFTVVQSSGANLHVDIDNFPATQPVSGTVTANQGTSPWVVSGTVTANAGTNLNTSALALDTTVSGLQVSQGSTTAGEKGPLIQGAVTTAAPTYTTAQTNPLSLTTSGALRVDASATTQPISGTVNAKAATPTAGTITQAAITVGTTAVRATVSGSAPSATRSVLLVSPDSASSAKFYMGTSTVTNSGATRGFQLLGGDQVAFNSDAGDYWIISDTAGQTVYILEQA